MNCSVRTLLSILSLAVAYFPAHAAEPLSLLDAQVTPSSAQVTWTRHTDPVSKGLTVNIAPGNDNYPGITLANPNPFWDLAAYGHVEACVRNLGTTPTTVCLRIDDNGDWKNNPWNAENLSLQPGATGTVKVIFGHSFGFKPAYKLKPEAVTKILLFASKSKDAPGCFRVESLAAAGEAGEKPPIDLNNLRSAPPGGVLLSADGGVAMQSETRDLTAVWSGSGTNGTVLLALADGKKEGSATFRPAVGRWTLRDGNQLAATLSNDGNDPLTVTITLANDRTKTDPVTIEIVPGARQSLTLPFASRQLWNGNDKKSGTLFASDRANAITLALKRADEKGDAALRLERLAIGTADQRLPEWLGKRPPVEGDWKATFSDDFEGTTVDTNKWSYYGENYWDKVTHFTKDTTFVKDGLAHLRLEKRRGHHNDDPKRPPSEYATGFLESYGKFTQRYGYFEARMKLPTAPGLWPAFWMMPDRGGNGPQWQRSDTKNGGMEFDIMEHLTRWGVNRFNIATHWDGYGNEHKSNGSHAIYYTPDKDGFVISGLLWTPGELVFYCQGQEIGRWKNERVMSVPGHILFTLPAGGWDNDWLDDAKLPDEFLIDYVRVWQRADLSE